MEKRSYLKGYLFVAIAGSLWGIGGFFVTKMIDNGASSLMTAFAGHFLAFIPLLLYLLAKNGLVGLKISRKGLVYSILLGVLSKGIFKLSLDTSMALVGVATSTILMYLAPVWTAIMAMAFFKEKLRIYQHFALVLNLIGCILMVTGGNFRELNISGLGLTLGFVAGFLYALSTILGKLGTSGDDSVTMACYMLFLLNEQINLIGYFGIIVMLASIVLMNIKFQVNMN